MPHVRKTGFTVIFDSMSDIIFNVSFGFAKRDLGTSLSPLGITTQAKDNFMLKTKAVAATITFAVLSGFSMQAAAGDIAPSWYLGADVGMVNEFQPQSRVDTSQLFTNNNSDTVFAIHGGYRISPYFAIEATFADLGDYSYESITPCPIGYGCIPEAGHVQVSVSFKRLDLAFVGSIPLGKRLEVYAKAGFTRTEVVSYIGNPFIHGVQLTNKNSSSDAVYGAGLRMHFDAPWSLRLQWDRTQLSYSLPDVDTWWLGAEYRFGSR